MEYKAVQVGAVREMKRKHEVAECPYCFDGGWRHVAIAPDDFDYEVCDCEAGESLDLDDPLVD